MPINDYFATILYNSADGTLSVRGQEAPAFLRGGSILTGPGAFGAIRRQLSNFSDHSSFYYQFTCCCLANPDACSIDNTLLGNVLLANQIIAKAEHINLDNTLQAAALIELACLKFFTTGRL